MNKKQRNKWKKSRANGRKHYILHKGIIGRGIFVGILVLAMRLSSNFQVEDLVFHISIAVGIGIFVGVVYGWAMWGILETAYQKTIKKTKNS